jgi:hypothetical protein
MPARDHLFVSYAVEDAALADWFARRLASLGYAVWYDRFKLLGGEPWPQDIEAAIDQRTFRMLALISHASKDKRNPTGERKKGESVGQRLELADFVIPLNVDLATSEVPWDLMGTQYIDFSHSWAKGLADVLAKLEKVHAPRALTDGPTLVQQTVVEEGAIRQRPEILSTNCLRIRDIPSEVLRCTFREDLTTAQKETLRERWAFRTLSDNTVISLSALPSEAMGSDSLERVDRQRWREADEVFGIKARDAVVSLVHTSIDLHLRSTGFVRDPYGWHVPHEFRPKSKLWFQKIDGSRTWVKGNGQRFFGQGQARRPYRYYLGANIRVLRTDSLEDLSLMVKLRVHLTNTTGDPFGKRGGLARRKHLCKNWWNNEWLARTLAIVQTLWTEDGLIRAGDVVVDGWPILLNSPLSIHEEKTEKPDDETLNKSGSSDDAEGDE